MRKVTIRLKISGNAQKSRKQASPKIIDKNNSKINYFIPDPKEKLTKGQVQNSHKITLRVQ